MNSSTTTCFCFCVAFGSLALLYYTSEARKKAGTVEGGKVSVRISATTKYIISTSGRPKSLRRYRYLLQELLGLDVAYIPISSPHGKIDPACFTNTIKGMNCIGGAISKDIKNAVIPFLDEIDELAKQVQSVNTVVRLSNDKLKGYNTDALGFKHAITTGIARAQIKVKTAIVYGYGGVSSVVFHVLQQLGIEVHVTGRNLERAAARAKEFNVFFFDPKQHSDKCFDLFVNATPVTDRPLDNAGNFLEALHGCKVAFDHEMPGQCLADYCMEKNVVHIPGTEMYYPQMRMQWQFFLQGIVPQAEIAGLLMEADRNAS